MSGATVNLMFDLTDLESSVFLAPLQDMETNRHENESNSQ